MTKCNLNNLSACIPSRESIADAVESSAKKVLELELYKTQVLYSGAQEIGIDIASAAQCLGKIHNNSAAPTVQKNIDRFGKCFSQSRNEKYEKLSPIAKAIVDGAIQVRSFDPFAKMIGDMIRNYGNPLLSTTE